MLNTLNLRHVVGIFVFLFLGATASAQVQFLTGDYLVGSSPDLLTSKNKIGELHKGSTYRIVSRTQKADGERLEIEAIALTTGSYLNPSPTGKFYLYNPKTARSAVEAGVTCTTCGQAQTAGSAKIDISKVGSTRVGGPKLSGPLDAKIKNYSESPQVKRMIDWAMKAKFSASIGLCYRLVKEAIANQCGPNIYREDHSLRYACKNRLSPEGGKKGPGDNLTQSVLTGAADEAALSAKTRLKTQGFINLLDTEPYKTEMRSPSDAPRGAILVYSSGVPCKHSRIADCGHAEIKTGNPGEPGYVSDYYSADAINETPRARKYPNNYRLVGVMIKP
jgi:hypothetical protein